MLEGSPAAEAGLEQGDAIVQFGWADSSNHDKLAALSKIVRNSIDQPIKVKLLRKTSPDTIEVVLTPHTWSGRGVLGCRFVPNPL